MASAFEEVYVVYMEDLYSLYLKVQQECLVQRVTEVQLVAAG